MVAPVFGALCVQCVCNVSGGGISAHVLVGVRMNFCMGVAGVTVEDAPVLYGGVCGQKEGGVRRVDGGDGSERMVRTDKEDAKSDS